MPERSERDFWRRDLRFGTKSATLAVRFGDLPKARPGGSGCQPMEFPTMTATNTTLTTTSSQFDGVDMGTDRTKAVLLAAGQAEHVAKDVQLLLAGTNDGSVPWFATATPEQQASVAKTWADSGMTLEECVGALASFASYAEYDSGTTPKPVVDGAAVLAKAIEQPEPPAVPAWCSDTRMVQAFRSAKRGECKLRLNAARLAQANMHHKVYVAKTHKRDNAIAYIAAEMGNASGQTTKPATVNRAIGCWQVTQVFGIHGEASWGVLECFVPLLDHDLHADTYTLNVKDGILAEARALYAQAVSGKLTVDVARDSILLLQAKRDKADADAAKAKLAALGDKAGSGAKEAAKAAQELADATAARAAAKLGDKAATDAGLVVPVTVDKDADKPGVDTSAAHRDAAKERAIPEPLQKVTGGIHAATEKDAGEQLAGMLKGRKCVFDVLAAMLAQVCKDNPGEHNAALRSACIGFGRKHKDHQLEQQDAKSGKVPA
jgi:hypothetical protein